MKSEQYIVEQIIELEAQMDPLDEYAEFDEGQQAELSVLYTILDRDLTKEEHKTIMQKRKEYLGD